MIDYNKLYNNNTYVIDTYSRVMNYTLGDIMHILGTLFLLGVP